MATTKELLKLDALIGKKPFERTLPNMGACGALVTVSGQGQVGELIATRKQSSVGDERERR